MERILTNTDKVKTTIYKNVTIADGVIIFIIMMLSLSILQSSINLRIYLIIFMDALLASSMFSINDEKIYESIYYIIKYFIVSKLINKIQFMNSKGIIEEIYRSVENIRILKIGTIPFTLISETEQDIIIDKISNLMPLLRENIDSNLVSITKELDLSFVKENYESLKKNLQIKYNSGEIDREEFLSRLSIVNSYLSSINLTQNKNILTKEFYLLLNKENDEFNNELISTASEFSLEICEVYSNEDKKKVIQTISKINKESVVDIKGNCTVIDKVKYKYLYIDRLPSLNQNGYLEKIFRMENVETVSLIFKPINKDAAIKRIDNSILEVESKNLYKTSSKIDRETIISSLENILVSIKEGGEIYTNFSIILMCKEVNVKAVKKELKMINFRGVERVGRIAEIVKKMHLIKNSFKESKGVNASSLIASFPFSSLDVNDSSGIALEIDKNISQIDFFKRDEEHLNSNMVVIGKSGSGKSYFSKTLISNLALQDTRIFILDPEGEYERLVASLGGEVINVGDSNRLSINPLEVMNEEKDLISHLEFLEEFYRTIFPSVSQDDLDELIKETKRLYKDFNIDKNTDLSKLKSSDYPTFKDLNDKIKNKKGISLLTQKIVDVYIEFNTQTTKNVSKKVIDLSFIKLMGSKNKSIINANMLLILKYLEDEVIKARNKKEKTIIVIDEAHLFIDEKFPVALDFMYEMAKRIRKYNGMQIMITQNIKDFCLSEEIKRKSMAIISVSQYSLIFSLSPADLKDLCSLYEVKRLNEKEIDLILRSKLGHTFFIKNPMFRTSLKIVTPKLIEKKFN